GCAYGRGSVTYIAFDLEKAPFVAWRGRTDFLAGMVRQLEPASATTRPNELPGQDLTTQLHRALDVFDVPIISFGWVALFMVLFIGVVVPLIYFVLPTVCRRLEGTWTTFPAVAVLVGGLAWFTAHNVKNRELRINQIDLVDFDLRTDLGPEQKPRQAFAYGQTW